MANPLFQALGGSPASAVPQPSAPSPAGPPAVGDGSSLYASLQPPQADTGDQPLQPGMQVAQGSTAPTPTPAPDPQKVQDFLKGFHGVR